MIIQLSEKVWYILKIDIAAWLAAILLIYYIVHWSKRFMLDEMTLHQIYWGIAGSYDPDLPLNLGSKIRSRSRFKIGIGSDRNRSEVIKIYRDREKIVDLQCTAHNPYPFSQHLLNMNTSIKICVLKQNKLYTGKSTLISPQIVTYLLTLKELIL